LQHAKASMTGRPYALALGLALVTAGFAETGTFSYFAPSLESAAAADHAGARDQEWIVSEIAGSMLNIAAYAGHFDAADPFQARHVGTDANGAQRFSLTRRAEEYTVTATRPWTPGAYVRVARSLMADGAGLSVTEDLVGDRVEGAGVQAVSRLLQNHPRSAAVHERAALLIGNSVQKRAAASPGFDARPALCRMTAHLAVARALHPAGLTKDGRAAEELLSTLAVTQSATPPPAVGADHAQFWIIEQ
jgi:hypothetical protein